MCYFDTVSQKKYLETQASGGIPLNSSMFHIRLMA